MYELTIESLATGRREIIGCVSWANLQYRIAEVERIGGWLIIGWERVI